MFQDIGDHVFHNEWSKEIIRSHDSVIVFADNRILMKYAEDSAGAQAPRITYPNFDEVRRIAPSAEAADFTYLFRIDDRKFFLLARKLPEEDGWEFRNPQDLRRALPAHLVFAGVTARHLATWYRDNRYCGRCGAIYMKKDDERALVCPGCGQVIYPRINPVVIVAVIDPGGTKEEDRILLTRYSPKHGGYARHALIAGFCEFGEELEGTVRREVMEEVGLKVKDIRYFRSQPWGYSNSLLSGYFCHVDGSSEIRIDEDELSEGVWYTRDQVPEDDTAFSLTWTMIRRFRDGLER